MSKKQRKRKQLATTKTPLFKPTKSDKELVKPIKHAPIPVSAIPDPHRPLLQIHPPIDGRSMGSVASNVPAKREYSPLNDLGDANRPK